ncbi:MAG: tetratricopeptide repeat protein [Pseudohongiella sp.]|uniref:tetratricopeptide repeat protein n=1 Tax=Pseudohongiella sp. TaxID=1979412 RepID=UPI0034A09810
MKTLRNHVRHYPCSCLLLLVALLPACHTLESSQPSASPEPFISQMEGLYGPRPEIVTSEQLHRLTPEQEREFLAYFNAPIRSSQPPQWRLIRYLEARLSSFSYRGETLTAEQSIASGGGNCLSLAIMTTAFAQLVGVDTAFQLMDERPVYEIREGVVEKGVHIRSLLLDPGWTPAQGLLGRSRGITVDYFPSGRERFVRNLRYADYLAMYYRNVAVEALNTGDLNKAFWLSMEALQHAPDSSETLNLLAVVNRKAGHVDLAERTYLYALEHASEKLTLLKNYRTLLALEGRNREATLIDQRLRRIEDPSPHNWYLLAQSSYAEGNYAESARYYQRAIAIAPYLDEAHLGLALSLYGMGKRETAVDALQLAIDNAGRSRERRLYKAKLESLQHTL